MVVYIHTTADSHLDGEVIPHAFPKFETTQGGHPAASASRSVIVDDKPDGVERADQPEASEEQVKEEEDAGGC